MTAVMPRVFVVVPIMVVIPIAFARLDDARRRERDESDQETELCDAQRCNHQRSPNRETRASLAQIVCGKRPPIAGLAGAGFLHWPSAHRPAGGPSAWARWHVHGRRVPRYP